MADHPPVHWRLVLCSNEWHGDHFESHYLSILDGIATNIELIYGMNRSTQLSFTVPSEDPRVNLQYAVDGLPYLSCGLRAVKAYRRVGEGPGGWELKFAGRVWSLEDHGDGDTVQTMVICYDPLKILEKRVCRDKNGLYFPNPDSGSTFNQVKFWRAADAQQTPDTGDGGVHDIGDSGDFGGSYIIKSLITRTIKYGNGNPGGPYDPKAQCHIDTGGDWAATAPMTLTFDTGVTIMEALAQICNTLTVDLNMEYLDVFNGVFLRLGATARLGGDSGATIAYAAPPYSASEYDRTINLDTMANYVHLFGKKQKGYDAVAKDESKMEMYNLMEQIENVSDVEHGNILGKLALMRVAMQKDPRDLITVIPTPEGAPLPWDDYNIGDTVTIQASANAVFPPTREEVNGVQRVYGWKITIDDDFGEYVSQLIVSPQDAAS